VYERLILKVICTVNGQRVVHGPVHVSYKYLRNLPNEKKGKRSPVVVGYLLCTKISAFFILKRLIKSDLAAFNTNSHYRVNR
jgi:hypothetical protein